MVKRILIFLGALVVLYFGAMVVSGAILGGMVGAHATNKADIPRLVVEASTAFAFKYRPMIFAAAAAIAALIAFGIRVSAFLVGVPIAVLGYLGLQQLGTTQEARFKASPFFARLSTLGAATPAPIPAAMQSNYSGRAALLTPVTLKTTYGQITLPKGSQVTILSENESTATVKAASGTTFTVPLGQLQQ